MWLLNVHTRQLEFFVDETKKYGRYAILSHTWEDDEVSFQDVQNGTASAKEGYAKIENTCRQAIEDKLDYCWVDTCCIDKLSSAELSEAINSMYRWYYQAKVCYAYLSDVPEVPLEKSRWFTRGWTLQELIAPAYMVFFDTEWQSIGSKIDMVSALSAITKIDKDVVRDRELVSTKSVAARMAWAAERETSRVEDRAYSLLGIFDVSMPMLYGEGAKAFQKLQEEIIRTSTDQSLLTWDPWEPSHKTCLFAPSPYGFRHCRDVISWSTSGMDESLQMSNKALRICLPVFEQDGNKLVAVLNCRKGISTLLQVGLVLRREEQRKTLPVRTTNSLVCALDGVVTSNRREVLLKHLQTAKWTDLLILSESRAPSLGYQRTARVRAIQVTNLVSSLDLMETSPAGAYDSATGTVYMASAEAGFTRTEITSRNRSSGQLFRIMLSLTAGDDDHQTLLVGLVSTDSGPFEPLREPKRAKFNGHEYLSVECSKSPYPNKDWELRIRTTLSSGSKWWQL